MAVQVKFFNIPVQYVEEAEEKLNAFLKTVRVVEMDRKFVELGSRSFWTVSVEFHTSDGRPKSASKKARTKIDYKSVLSQEEFALFVRLREWRKETAAKEGIPVYVILTNDQLAVIAKEKPASPAQLAKLEGIGEARIEKYGRDVCHTFISPVSTTGSRRN